MRRHPDLLLADFLNLVTFLMLAWLLWLCQFGLDFSDEGFYLVWAANPFLYEVSTTQFGFVYHPLYLLLNGDIAGFRQANLLLTFSLAWFASYQLLHRPDFEQSFSLYPRASISAALALSAFLMLRLWLPTPNYNGLALQALCLASAGLLMASPRKEARSLAGWMLLGLAGSLLFLAKPTSAIALTCLTGLYLFLARKFSLVLICLSAAIALLCFIISALLIDGSIGGFIQRLIDGVVAYTVLDAEPLSLFRLEPLALPHIVSLALFALTVAVFMLIAVNGTGGRAGRVVGSLFLLALGATTLAILAGTRKTPIIVGPFQELLLAALPFGMLAATLALHRTWRAPLQLERWALILFLLGLPYAFVFGSNNNYWSTATHAIIFWIMAGAVLLQSTAHWKALLAAGFCAQLLVAVQLNNAALEPYRQPYALSDQSFEITLPGTGAHLRIAHTFGEYLGDVMGLVHDTGMPPGTPVIDFTGHSPTVLHVMGARSIGQAWMVGGYPGSNTLAKMMLSRVPCQDLAKAWLLTEPDGPKRLDLEAILPDFGADPLADYTIVGSLPTPPGKSGYPETFTQELRRPVRSVMAADQACIAARKRE